MAFVNKASVDNALLKAWPKQMEERVVSIQKRFALMVLGARVGGVTVAGLLFRNPVDTGTSRANWQVSINTPAGGIIETSVAGGRSGSAPSAEEIARALTGMAGLEAFETIWISNNLPYIARLNEGHSPQASPGWIEDSVENAISASRVLNE